MKKVLGLDVSSSTVGWSLFEYDSSSANLLKYGCLKPPTKKQAKGSTAVRLIKASEDFKDLIALYQPDEIVIEDYAKRFSMGRTTAQTIILLACFNELFGMIALQEIKKEPFRYPVVSIRSVLTKHFGTKIVSKDEIYPVIVQYCSKFIQPKNKKGNIAKEAGDIADAIALNICHILKQSKGTLKWDL